MKKITNKGMATDLKDRAGEIYPQVQHQIAKLNKEKPLKGRKISRKHDR